METDLKKLENELDLVDIPDFDKKKVINVFKSWKTCYNNQIIIDDISNMNRKSIIKIDDKVVIDGVEIYKNISKKSTIFFSNCENLNILLLNKINHVVIENCKNVNFKSTSGIIGGIDVLHSQNMNFIIINQDVFYMSFGGVSTSNIYIDKSLALNTLLSTLHCNRINFVNMVDEILENVKYITNSSLLSGFYMMMFVENDVTGVYELHYIYKDNEGNQTKGIIYPN